MLRPRPRNQPSEPRDLRFSPAPDPCDRLRHIEGKGALLFLFRVAHLGSEWP